MNTKSDTTWDIDVETCKNVLNSVKSILVEKNKRYGNSALEPINVFYKGNASNSILIRLDDKLSRIKNSSALRKNDLYDLLGYCLLLLVSFDNSNTSFEEKVHTRIKQIESDYVNGVIRVNKYLGDEPYPKTGCLYDGFSKTNNVDTPIIKSLNGVCSDIKQHDIIHEHLIQRLINFLIVYFIQNGITDFSDLID